MIAFDGAQPFVVLAAGAEARPAHPWYHGFRLAVEEARGLDALDDHLHAGTFGARLEPGGALTLVLSAEAAPSVDGETAWDRRRQYEAKLLAQWERAQPAATQARAPWSKQFCHYDLRSWLEGDRTYPASRKRRHGQNHEWIHLNNDDVVSMPDKWEYPWTRRGT